MLLLLQLTLIQMAHLSGQLTPSANALHVSISRVLLLSVSYTSRAATFDGANLTVVWDSVDNVLFFSADSEISGDVVVRPRPYCTITALTSILDSFPYLDDLLSSRVRIYRGQCQIT